MIALGKDFSLVLHVKKIIFFTFFPYPICNTCWTMELGKEGRLDTWTRMCYTRTLEMADVTYETAVHHT